MKNIKNNQTGFTRHELIIAVSVTGLMALIAGFLLHNSRQETRDLKRLADVKTVQHALELYYYECNQYPVAIAPGKAISGVEQCQGNVYLQSVPTDPDGSVYKYVPCRDETIKECFEGLPNPGAYQLYYKLESNTEGIRKGMHLAVPGNFVAQ